MSKARAHARVAREAASQRERAQIARRRARTDRALRLRPSLPPLPRRRRRRRYGAAAPRTIAGLLLGWLVAQILIWQFISGTQARIGLALVGLAVLPVILTSSRSHR